MVEKFRCHYLRKSTDDTPIVTCTAKRTKPKQSTIEIIKQWIEDGIVLYKDEFNIQNCEVIVERVHSTRVGRVTTVFTGRVRKGKVIRLLNPYTSTLLHPSQGVSYDSCVQKAENIIS